MREAREMRNVSVIGGGCVGRGAALRFAWAGGATSERPRGAACRFGRTCSRGIPSPSASARKSPPTTWRRWRERVRNDFRACV